MGRWVDRRNAMLGNPPQVRAELSPVVGQTSYHGATQRRRYRFWTPSGADINSIITAEGATLRRRSRDLVRNNDWAATIVEQHVSNMIGLGIRPYWGEISSSEVRRNLRNTWKRWVEDADPGGRCDFYGLEALVERTAFVDGECFARIRMRRPDDDMTVPMQIQVLSPDHVPLDKNEQLSNGRVIRNGIEFDRIGRRAAYYFYRYHPGDMLARDSLQREELVRVPADQVLHVFYPLQPNQVRGLSAISVALLRLHNIDKYDHAELVRKVIASSMTGFIQQESGYEPTEDSETSTGQRGNSQVESVDEPLTAGTLIPLEPGQDIRFPELPTAGDYDRFMPAQLRAAAASTGQMYEHATGDLSKVNYSSARVGMIALLRRVQSRQAKGPVFQFCKPVLRRWLEQAALSGAVQMPGYSRNRQPYEDAIWVPHGFDWVDPERQVRAATQMVRSGFSSHSRVVLGLGIDPDEEAEQMAEDLTRMDELGISSDADPRRSWKGGATTSQGGGAAEQGDASGGEEDDEEAA